MVLNVVRVRVDSTMGVLMDSSSANARQNQHHGSTDAGLQVLSPSSNSVPKKKGGGFTTIVAPLLCQSAIRPPRSQSRTCYGVCHLLGKKAKHKKCIHHTMMIDQERRNNTTSKRHINFKTRKLFEKAVNPGTTSRFIRRKILFFWVKRRTHKLFFFVRQTGWLSWGQAIFYVHAPLSLPSILVSLCTTGQALYLSHLNLAEHLVGDRAVRALVEAPQIAVLPCKSQSPLEEQEHHPSRAFRH